PVAPGGLGAAKPEVYLELHPAEMVLGAARRRQAHLGQPQQVEEALQVRDLKAQIDEGPQGHVPADAGEAVKEGPVFTGWQGRQGVPPPLRRGLQWRAR